MKILVDTKVILDVLLKRRTFGETALRIFALVETGEMTGYLCGTTVTTVYYIVCKHLGKENARNCISTLLRIFKIARVDRSVLSNALSLEFRDFEDALLHEAAKAVGAAGIITRDADYFKHAVLPIFDPKEIDAALRGKFQSSGEIEGAP